MIFIDREQKIIITLTKNIMKTLTRMMFVVLLGLAISLVIKNTSLQSELNELTEDEVRTEWIKAQVELSRENKNIIVVEDGRK